MTTYTEMVRVLGPAEAFDREVFEGDTEWPQDLCNLMLALALAYNDFKDVLTAHVVLNTVRPSGEPKKTAPWGNHGGITVHIQRVQCGLVYELLELLRKSSQILHSSKFQFVVRKLSASDREAWQGLEDAAMQRASTRPLTEALKAIRDKVAFHYDSEKIADGYGAFFREPGEQPMYSRAENLPGCRFYFADAAALRATMNASEEKRIKGFLEGSDKLLSQIHLALFHLVAYFIQLRQLKPVRVKKKRIPALAGRRPRRR